MWSKWVWVRRIASTCAPGPACDRGEDPLRLIAGVDDDQLVATLAPDQEGVLGDLADRQHLDVERHRLRPFAVADPLALAFAPHCHVDPVAGRM